MPARLKRLLTVAEVACELGLSASRVRALIAAGRLKASKLGSQWIVIASDVDAVRTRVSGRPKGN